MNEFLQAILGALQQTGQPASPQALAQIPSPTLRDIYQRLQQNNAATLGGKFLLPVAGEVQNPLHDVPVLGGAMDVAATGLPNLAGLLLTELAPQIGKTATGAALAGIGGLNRALPAPLGQPDRPLSQTPIFGPAAQAFANTPGDFVAKARAANEAGASGNGVPVGALNLALDPSNYIGLGETVGAGAKAEKVAAKVARAGAASAPVEDLTAILGGQTLPLADAIGHATTLNAALATKRFGVRQVGANLAQLIDTHVPTPGVPQVAQAVQPQLAAQALTGPQNVTANAVSFLGALRHAASQGFEAEVAALKRPAGKITPKVLSSLWAQQVVTTVRNFLQDTTTGRLWLARQGLDRGAYDATKRSLDALVVGTKQNPTDLLHPGLQQVITSTGVDDHEFMKALADAGVKGADQFAAKEFSPGAALGQSFHRQYSKAAENVNAVQSGLANMLFASTSGLGAAANAAIPTSGAIYGFLKGLIMPGFDRAFEILNGLTHMSLRGVVAEDESRSALAQAAPKLIDVVDHLKGNTTNLSPDGLFTAEDVLNALGVNTTKLTSSASLAKAIAANPAAKAWQEAQIKAAALGFDRSKQLFADFSKQNPVDKVIGGAIPFTAWASRAMSRTIQQLAENPAVALTLTHALQNDTAMLRNKGLPGYLMGALPVSDQTPVVGALARLVNGGQAGTLYVNPTATLSPINASLLGADVQHQSGLPPGNITTLDTGTQYAPTLYQKAIEPLDAMGYQFSPLIQALAYITGQDFQRPGSLDRYAGIEAGLPGDLNVPDVYHRLLGAAREKLTGSSDTYDPVLNRVAEIVMRETGKPISFPENRALALQSQNIASPLYQQALNEMQTGGLVKNIISTVNPTQTESTTAVKERQLAAMATMFPPDVILQAAQTDPAVADAMVRYNAQLRTGVAVPAAATYTKPQVPAVYNEDPRVVAWEQAHAWLGLISPAEYQAERNAYALSLGFNVRQQPIASLLPGPTVAAHLKSN